MRRILFSLALTLSFSAVAESIPYNYYSITSDLLDQTITPGTCEVYGKVNTLYEQPVSQGLISNLDRSHFCYTAVDGTFHLTLSGKDTALFFYHENYGEIVIWNYPFQSQHRVVINFVTQQDSESDIQYIQEKPVIYLYAEKPTALSLSINHDPLTFTQRAYDNRAG